MIGAVALYAARVDGAWARGSRSGQGAQDVAATGSKCSANQFRTDPAVQDAQLAELRDAIESAPISTRPEKALETVQRSFPTGTSIPASESPSPPAVPAAAGKWHLLISIKQP